MIVKDLMKEPIVIDKDMTLEQASKMMSKEKISSIIIVKAGKPAGIITHEDLVDNFGKKTMVSEVMSRDLVFIKENDKAQKAVEVIKENGISVLPVLDKKGSLVGVIHVKELLKQMEEDEFLLD